MTSSSLRGPAVGLLGCGALAGAVLVLGAVLTQVTGRHYVLSGAISLVPVVVLGLYLVRRLHAHEPLRVPAGASRERVVRSPFERLEALESRLRSDPRHGDQYEFTVRPVLVVVLEDRLRRHHGVDLFAEPARARELVGEQVWELLDRPPLGAAPEITRLHGALRRIEEL